ncbi:hypothetical protein D3P96_01755 [Weissella viridescens]|uniref:Uncharacterized protein n=1 Tax=Weissella viridescens TaxID=1629 RepID=A0A3P2RDN6_WEIVI|nr:hypothetical protein [Weissella viridescens]RRG18734.1 hypothetical protein D3P96_01755 [Weissella viridescens]
MMKKLLVWVAGVCWLGLISYIGWAIYNHDLASQLPIFAYNQPQGMIGWGLVTTVIITLIAWVWPKPRV